tara:strand:- start:1237 stop:1830 length:594 start_codon:yes stop_codon:yes gene_type:complete
MRKTERHIRKRNRFPIIFPIVTIIGIGIVVVLSSFYEKSWIYDWNGIRQQIKDSVKVAEYGGISSGVVGIAAKRPKQFDRRVWIMKNATESELLKLTEYPNGTIKSIAYEGLIRKPEFKNKTDLILKAISDTEYPIEFQSGCVGTNMNISEYLVDFVLYIDDKSPPSPIGFENTFGLSESERNKILAEYRKIPSLWK